MRAFGRKSVTASKEPTVVHDHSKKSGINLDDTVDNFGHDNDLNLADTKLLTHF